MPKPASNEAAENCSIGSDRWWHRRGRSVKRKSSTLAPFFFANSSTALGSALGSAIVRFLLILPSVVSRRQRWKLNVFMLRINRDYPLLKCCGFCRLGCGKCPAPALPTRRNGVSRGPTCLGTRDRSSSRHRKTRYSPLPPFLRVEVFQMGREFTRMIANCLCATAKPFGDRDPSLRFRISDGARPTPPPSQPRPHTPDTILRPTAAA